MEARIGITARPLSPRQREVLDLVSKGRSNKEIAEALYLTPETVKNHVTGLMMKLGVKNRTELALMSYGKLMRPSANTCPLVGASCSNTSCPLWGDKFQDCLVKRVLQDIVEFLEGRRQG